MPGAKLWGKDYANSTAAVEVWIPLKLLPDGSIAVTSSTVIVEGVATAGGTPNMLVDNTKDWDTDILEGALVQFVHLGVEYTRPINANIATAVTWETATAFAPAAGDVYRILRSEDPMTPLSKGVIHNTAYVTPNDFFGTALAPTIEPTLFRCQGLFDAAGVLSVRIIRGGVRGGVNVGGNFNHGVVLGANELYVFDTLVQLGDTINYRYSASCNILSFKVLEIPAAI